MASKPVPTRASSRSRIIPPTKAAPGPARTTRTRAASKQPEEPAVAPPAAKKTTSRKPLEKRENIDVPATTKAKPKPTSAKAFKQAVMQADRETEPIMAYLRIRPNLGEESSTAPYLIPISDTAVKMEDPQDTQNARPQYRASVAQPSSIYRFSHVFPPNTSQQDFFTKTTLPLVKDVLYGQSGLLFTYGVTNSGKTYTVQGGTEKGTAGILPRTLDVIFNSIEGLHGDGRYRPVRLYGVEPSDASDSNLPQVSSQPALAEVFESLDQGAEPDFDVDQTVIPVDRNHEYTVWISYAEVYNEKVYDLLADAKGESDTYGDNPAPRGGPSNSLLLSRKALTLRPSPASDNPDAEVNGKYVSGLRQFRIHSATQAKALVKLGNLHRRVFGTLANRESSRSHGMVIIKIIRGHRGDRDDPTALQVSRLTLVDLAGSERTRNTQTTGERLKEAGNINKSLMVLGQCMEVLRSNQRKLAMSLAQESTGKPLRMDTRDVKRTLAVVPFRHSKLTECLMDYFVGDSRAVMIVNINPYDTGYDENSHVMKFASLAREITVTPAAAPVHKPPPAPVFPGPGKTKGHKIKELGPATLKGPEVAPNPGYRRKVTIESVEGQGKGRVVSQTILEVLEEDETRDEENSDDEDDEPGNPLVDALFDEIERLRLELFEAEMRAAVIEAETREEVMLEMEERMRLMEQKYSKRLMSEMERNEMKIDAKIDMLHQGGMFGSPMKARQTYAESYESEEEEEDVEMSLVEYGAQESSDSDDEMNISSGENSRSPSPLARKAFKPPGKQPATPSTPKVIIEKRPFIPDPEPLPSDGEDAELTEVEDSNDETSEPGDDDDEEDEDDDDEPVAEEDDDDDDEYNEDDEEEEEEDDWVPPPPPSAKKTPRRSDPKGSATANASASKSRGKVAKLPVETPASSAKTPQPPKKKMRKSALSDSEDEEDEEEAKPVAPKKKRQLAKKAIVTVDNVEQVTWEAEKVNATHGKTIRRLGPGN